MFAFPKKQCSFIVKVALPQDNPVCNRITLKPEKHWLILQWNKNDSDFDKFRNSCAARTSYTREEGSEPAELNGFSSLNVFFAQRCEMCRATDTLSDISPPTQTPQISIFLSKRLVEVGTVRSLIRGGGRGRGNGGVCGGVVVGWEHGRIWGDLRDSRGSCAKEAGLEAAVGTFIFTVSSTTYWQIQETV